LEEVLGLIVAKTVEVQVLLERVLGLMVAKTVGVLVRLAVPVVEALVHMVKILVHLVDKAIQVPDYMVVKMVEDPVPVLDYTGDSLILVDLDQMGSAKVLHQSLLVRDLMAIDVHVIINLIY